jgi:hypothetical protein
MILKHPDLPPEAFGVHLDEFGQPFSLVRFSPSWSLTASHECLEMLADPFGSRLVAASSVLEYKNGQARVQYLVEVCDPCESSEYSYTVNDIIVSDFLTPHFFDPRPARGVDYDYTGVISAPRTVPSGGYVSFLDSADNHWHQLRNFDNGPEIVDLGILGKIEESLRTEIDRLTPHPELDKGIVSGSKVLVAATKKRTNAQHSYSSRAQSLRQQINRLIQRQPVGGPV